MVRPGAVRRRSPRRDRLNRKVAVEIVITMVGYRGQRGSNDLDTSRRIGVVQATAPVGRGVVVKRADLPSSHALVLRIAVARIRS